jgi:dTDP-4-dehydrorhamnose 3,5-epimerase-like enzyme
MNTLKLMEGKVAADDRGTVKFVNDFNFEGVKRFYMVENHRRGFIRAWHGHKFEGKYVFVPTGAALIGVVEMGEEKEAQKFVLCEEVPKVLWIPPGNFNGAMTLRENTKIIYFSTATLEETKGDDVRFEYDHWNIWEEVYR